MSCLLAVTGTVALASAGAATHRHASQRALATLEPAREPGIEGNVTVFAVAKLVKPGTTITAPGGSLRFRVRKPVWLYWEDLAHGYLFPHPSLLLLLDRSGHQVLRRGMSTYPLLGGRPPSFLRSPGDYFGARGAIYNRIRFVYPAAEPAAVSSGADEELPGVGMVTVGARDDPTFAGDLQGMETAGTHLHIKTVKAEPTVDGLEKGIEEQVKAGKYEILLYITGHGSPAESYYYAGKVKVPTTPAAQVDLNGRSNKTGHDLKASQLAEILEKYPKIKFDVVIDSCFSGRFIAVLSPLSNVAVTTTATDTGHVARAGFGAVLGKALERWAAPLNHVGPIDDLAEALESDTVKQAMESYHNQSPTQNFPKVAPRPPSLKPIHAVFSQSAFSTVYTEDASGEDLSYQWGVSIPADPPCAGGFKPGQPHPNQATWYHADASEGGPCSHGAGQYDSSGRGHPGTVAVLVSNDYWSCAATYFGSQGDKGSPTGDGAAPQACRFKP